MLAVVRFRVPSEEGDDFAASARRALEVLGARPGFVDGSLGRSADAPELWVLVTRWTGVGDYRRALSSYDAKLHVHPVLYNAIDEPTAFETLASLGPDGSTSGTSDRADYPR